MANATAAVETPKNASDWQLSFAQKNGIEGVTAEMSYNEAYQVIGSWMDANPLTDEVREQRKKERQEYKRATSATEEQKAAVARMTNGKVQVETLADADAFFAMIRRKRGAPASEPAAN